VQRFDRTGRALSLGPVTEHELDDRKASTMPDQGRALLRAVPDGARVVALDERGTVHVVARFAQMLETRRDSGAGIWRLSLAGPTGWNPFRCSAQGQLLSFGPMVWPHALARVMLCGTDLPCRHILAGGPYHRD
jgi:23S rRNA (pseudouridine1915-N3)-methyltransferase